MKEVSYKDLGTLHVSKKDNNWYYIIDSHNEKVFIKGVRSRFKTKEACARAVLRLAMRVRHMKVEESLNQLDKA